MILCNAAILESRIDKEDRTLPNGKNCFWDDIEACFFEKSKKGIDYHVRSSSNVNSVTKLLLACGVEDNPEIGFGDSMIQKRLLRNDNYRFTRKLILSNRSPYLTKKLYYEYGFSQC